VHISIRHKANPTEKMTDQAIIEALLNHDEELTRQFFFHNCRPLFCSIIRYVFSYEVDYDEFVNELYLHLMERDGARLRQFEGRSSLYQWLKVVAIRYFIAKRDRMIDPASEEALLEKSEHHSADHPETRMIASIDLENLLAGMANKRQSYVLRRLMIDDAEPQQVAQELQITVDNLYNIKKRALAALTRHALNRAENHEKESR